MKQNKSVNVDSGTILLADSSYYLPDELAKANEDSFYCKEAQIFKVEVGIYKVKVVCDNTCNGPICVNGVVEIPSGELIIADPCYIIRDSKWHEWLDNTDFGVNPNNGVSENKALSITEQGGDGCFLLKVELSKI